MSDIYKDVMRVIEQSGMTPLSISEIHRRLKNININISTVMLSGYLMALENLDLVAAVPASPAKGYMSVTSFWRTFGKKYKKQRKSRNG